jgi:hypothetical protein
LSTAVQDATADRFVKAIKILTDQQKSTEKLYKESPLNSLRLSDPCIYAHRPLRQDAAFPFNGTAIKPQRSG